MQPPDDGRRTLIEAMKASAPASNRETRATEHKVSAELLSPRKAAGNRAADDRAADDGTWNNGERVSLRSSAPDCSFDELTSGESAIFARMLRGATVEQIARECGCSKSEVRRVQRGMRSRIQDVMDEVGLTDAALVAKYLQPMLDAANVEYETVYDKTGARKTKKVETPAWNVRQSALDTALRMRGAFAADKSNAGTSNVAVQVHVNQAIGEAKHDE